MTPVNQILLVVLSIFVVQCSGEDSNALLERNETKLDKTVAKIEEYNVITNPKIFQESLRGLKPVTIKDLTDDLETWEAPALVRKSVAYYLSGYDDEERPLWIVEIGKVNMRKILTSGPEYGDVFAAFIRQAAYRIIKSMRNSTETGNLVTEMMFIVDMDGLDLEQIAHIPTVTYVLKLMIVYKDLILEHLGGTFVLNANALVQSSQNLVRPIFQGAMEKVEFFGTVKERWIPILRSKFPLEVLPPWYGGKPNYKPVAIYGA